MHKHQTYTYEHTLTANQYGVCHPGLLERGAVHDYCQKLNDALRQKGIAVEMAPMPHKREPLWPYLRQLQQGIASHNHAGTILHLHYPGWHQLLQYTLAPQILMACACLRKNHAAIVTTIHDFSKFSFCLRLVFVPLFILSNRLVFTTPQELETTQRFMAWSGIDLYRKSCVIPVGNNIAPPASLPPPASRNGVAHFGHIRSGKGIEAFLDAAEACHRQGIAMPFHLIGNVEGCDLLRHRYANRIIQRVYDLSPSLLSHLQQCQSSQDYRTFIATLDNACKRFANIHVHIGLSDEEVANLLTSCKYALMPFPDGASMRRGSLQAVLACKCVTITRWSDHTDDAIRNVTLPADTAQDVVRLLTADDAHAQLPDRIDDYIQSIAWPSIAERYIDCYSRV